MIEDLEKDTNYSILYKADECYNKHVYRWDERKRLVHVIGDKLVSLVDFRDFGPERFLSSYK
jgi:hypothetical protein